jgi:hypothetical protein
MKVLNFMRKLIYTKVKANLPSHFIWTRRLISQFQVPSPQLPEQIKYDKTRNTKVTVLHSNCKLQRESLQLQNSLPVATRPTAASNKCKLRPTPSL